MIGFAVESGSFTAPTNITAAELRTHIRLRRMRDRFFGDDLFADPAWDMLLDLKAAKLERVKVAASSLCLAAAVPSTTALRWIKVMCENGIFVRVNDPEDGRRVFVELSDGAAARMAAYLSAAKAQGGLAV
jgi:DNA-binding MarR family transcriptional regulator